MKTIYTIQQSNLSCLLTLNLRYAHSSGDNPYSQVPPPRQYNVLYYRPGVVKVEGPRSEIALENFNAPAAVKAKILERFEELFSLPVEKHDSGPTRGDRCEYHRIYDRALPSVWQYVDCPID